MCRLCEKDAFHTRSGNWTTLEYVLNGIYGSFTGGECSRHKIRPVGFSFLNRKIKNMGKIFKRDDSGIEW